MRAKLARWYAREQGLKNFGKRLDEQARSGGGFPATVALVKLVSATLLQETHAFLMDLDEYAGAFSSDKVDREEVFYQYLWSSAMRIAGGADEVLRNQLAERVLGMPGEMRADKGVPFNELPY